MMRMKLFCVLVPILLVGLVGCNGGASGGGAVSAQTNRAQKNAQKAQKADDSLEQLDSANFRDSTTIDNQWLPLKPGSRYTWEGTTIDDEGKPEPHRIILTVTDLTKVIGGVRTLVCWDQDFADDELVESEIAFYAQDKDGTVWYLGEYPEEYDEGKFEAAPCWIHGIKDGKAGIMMQAQPKLGTPSYAQGWAPSVEWTDRGVVDQVDQKVTVPAGTFQGVLVIAESSKEEPDAHQLKYYARGVGNIRVGWRGEDKSKESLDLVRIEQLNAQELAEAREEALKLEKHGFEVSKDVYALTKPLELLSGGVPILSSKKQTEVAKDSGPKITAEQAKEIALKTVAGEVTDVAIEKKLGKARYVVEVLTDDGDEIDVIIEMETGKVLSTEK